MFDKLSYFLSRNPFDFDFKDNVYNSESFFMDSIKSYFAGWYNPDDIRKQIDFILEVCLPDRQNPIMDAGCGHGEHSIALAKKGYSVIGIDISDALIEHLIKTENHGARFRKIRMTEIPDSEKYGLILILGNGLALMPIDECKKSLYQVHQAIKTGGHVFLQIGNKKLFVEKEANAKNWEVHENKRLNISEHYFDSNRSLEISRDISFDLAEKTAGEFVTVKRLYDPDEFVKILMTIGFTRIEYWGDWNNSSFAGDSPTLLIKAKK